MSFLSGLLGMVPVVGPLLSGISQGTSKAAAGAAAGRQTEAENILAQDALRSRQYDTHQDAEMQAGNLDLSRKGFEENARGGRAKQALIASILGGGYQPTQVSVPGVKNANVSGGLAASLGTEGGKASMNELLKQALSAQMQQGSPEGEQFSGGQVFTPPALSKLPQAGKLENILGGVGLGTSLLGSVLNSIKKTSGGADGGM